MKESLDAGIAKFIEKNADALRKVADEGTVDLGVWWMALSHIFDFNCLYIYDTGDGSSFRSSIAVKRDLLDTEPRYKDYFWLLKSAFDEDKVKSMQKEEELKDNMVFIEAIAAIPLVIGNIKKILIICKQLVTSKNEVIEGYVFDSYKLELYISVIKILVRVQEQQRQLIKNKSKITIFKLAAIAGGVFALLEGLSSAIGIIRESTLLDVTEGLTAILLLVFLISAIIRLWTS